MSKRYSLILIIFILFSLTGSDWPIYKGNIYFTGNNDEIIVKNSNLKWLFQGDDRVFNPVVSDGMVFFTDRRGNVYCLDEEFGKLIWKISLKEVSSRFKALSRSAGKVKYPLIKGRTLFLSDPIAIYAINKMTGKIIWARTGMRQQNRGTDLSGRMSMPMVDGIYSDPVILDDQIYYGTRNMFISREVRNGHMKWDNSAIKSYSGFPTFYDEYIFTQSMDYGTGIYTVYCLNAKTGKEIWKKRIAKPVKIFPPVIYKKKVFIPSSKAIHCLDLNTGEKKWVREYRDYITSNPSFTDRSILFSIGNSDIVIINPNNGEIINEIKVAPKSGPYFVTVRDQIYIAYNIYGNIKKNKVPYGRLRAVNFTENKIIWQYKTPFPGGVSQPITSKGIIFLPAGNYLYAIGTEYYARIIEGGSGHAVVPGQKKKDKKGRDVSPPQPRSPKGDLDKEKKIKTRKIEIAITDKDKQGIPAVVEIKKRKKGRIIYSKKIPVDKKGKVDVPEGDNVELLVTSPGYVPKKVIVNGGDKEKRIRLDKIETGKTYTIDNIHFEINRAYLKKESIDILDNLIKIMRQNRRLKLKVTGHTDSTGEEKYNQKLSERRADSVIEYMVKNGISPERLNSVGYGESKPVASNETKEGRRKNRRTEFSFFK